jgi:hypothetical protein
MRWMRHRRNSGGSDMAESTVRTKPYKAVAGLLVFLVGEALTLGLVPNRWEGWAQLVIAAAVYGGVYAVRNPPVTRPFPPPKG